MTPLRLLGIGVLLATGIAVGWITNGWRWEGRYADLQARSQTAARQASDAARQQTANWAAAAAAADARHTEELNIATAEIDHLRTAVAAGRQRLRVNARCPVPPSLPDRSGSAGMGDATAPELAGDAEQAYFALRAELSRMEAQLRWFQEMHHDPFETGSPATLAAGNLAPAR